MTAYSTIDRSPTCVEIVATWATSSGYESQLAVVFPHGAVTAAHAVAGGLTRLSVRAWQAVVDGEWNDLTSDTVVESVDGNPPPDLTDWPAVIDIAAQIGTWIAGTEQHRWVRPEVIREVNALNHAVRGSFAGRSYQAVLCDRRSADDLSIEKVHHWLVEWSRLNDHPDFQLLSAGLARLPVHDDAKAAAAAEWMTAIRLVAEQMRCVHLLEPDSIGEAVATAVAVHGRPISAVAVGAASVVGPERVISELVNAFITTCHALADAHGGEPVDVAVWVAGLLAEKIGA